MLLKAVPGVSILICPGNQPIQAIKGGEETPHNTHHFGEEEEKGGLYLLELPSKVG
jgi:hypothetical protein